MSNTTDDQNVVDDDGHELQDIVPWEIEEDDDDVVAQQSEGLDIVEDHTDWDREALGAMADYATAVEDEPECGAADNAEVGV